MDSSNANLIELQLDGTTHSYLREISRWTRFLSIAGFIFCGIFLLVGIFAGSILSSLGTQAASPMPMVTGVMMGAIYVVCALVYFFPCLFLYRFSSLMQAALRTSDQELLNSSFSNLRSCFKFLGILTIIGLAFWALIIVFGGLGALMGR
jgi:hypothetical protein